MARKRPPGAKGPVRDETRPGAAQCPPPMALAELKGIPAFHGMDDADAAAFLSLMCERRAAAGEPLFCEGDGGDGLFIILEGSVGITKRNAKGGEREVATLGKDESFGEMGLISDRPRSSGAKAKSESRLLFLPKEEFQKMLLGGNRGASSMVLYFARTIAARLDANNRRMLEFLDAAQRPASSEFSEFKRRLLREWTF